MKNLFRYSIILIIGILIISTRSNAAGLSVSVNNKNPEVGTSINLTIGNGIGGRVKIVSSNSNVVSVPASEFIDYNSKTISLSAKAAGTTTITVTAVDVVTTDETPKEVTGSSSVTITVKEKPAPVQTPPQKIEPSQNNGGNSNSNQNSSTKTPASNKTNTDKTKTQNVVETIIEEEAEPQFGINSLLIRGIKTNEETEEIEYTPTFNIDVYEYSCNISNDVEDINIITEAGKYNEFVKIEKPENLNAGENIIKITMSKDDNNITYTIKAYKEEKVEEIKEQEEIKKSDKLIYFTIPQFVMILLAVCIIEGVLLKMPWKKIISASKNRFNK